MAMDMPDRQFTPDHAHRGAGGVKVRVIDVHHDVQSIPSMRSESSVEAVTCPTPRYVTRVDRRAWILCWLAFVPFVLFRAGTLAEADTFWQVRAGLQTIDELRIPTHDTFSWTVYGHTWTLNSWGFNVVEAMAYKIAGLPAVAIVAAFGAAGVGALVLFVARRNGAHPVIAGPLLWIAAGPMVVYFSARPQLVDYAAVLLLLLLIKSLLASTRPGSAVAGVGLLSIVWVNLHSGALLAVAITSATCVFASLSQRTRSRVQWCLAATAASALGMVINPYGWRLFVQGAHVQAASAGLITEWRHLDPTNPLQLLVLALGIGAFVIAVKTRSTADMAVVAVSLVAGVWAIRFLAVLLLVSIPTVAAAMPDALITYGRSRRRMLRQGAIVAVGASLVLAVFGGIHLGRPDPKTYPRTLAADIPTGCNVYTTDLLGGFLILERPDVKVSLDGRNDLYDRGIDLSALGTLRGHGDVAQALRGAGCVLVPPTSGLADRLDHESGWKQVGAERAAVLFLRSGA